MSRVYLTLEWRHASHYGGPQVSWEHSLAGATPLLAAVGGGVVPPETTGTETAPAPVPQQQQQQQAPANPASATLTLFDCLDCFSFSEVMPNSANWRCESCQVRGHVLCRLPCVCPTWALPSRLAVPPRCDENGVRVELPRRIGHPPEALSLSGWVPGQAGRGSGFPRGGLGLVSMDQRRRTL